MIRLALIALAGPGLVACSAGAKPQLDLEVISKTGVPDITGDVSVLTSFPSDYVTARDVHVWLPPSYAVGDDAYPVLYMHDGQNVFDPALSKWSGAEWRVDEMLTGLIEDGKAREAIVVAVASLEDERFADYFPQKAATPENTPRFAKDYAGFAPEELGGDKYLRFLTAELKPYIDASYRTRPDPEDTAIMGSSMGGLISLYAISEYPDVFGQAAGVSTHFPLGDGALVDYFATRLPDPATHRLYFDHGTETLDENYAPYQERFDKFALAAGYVEGLNYISEVYPGHAHSETDWQKRVAEPLVFLLGAPE